MQIWPGSSYPLGATYDGAGTNFALFSEVATEVGLCLDDSTGTEERFPLPDRTGYVWHGTVVYEVHVKGFTQRHPDVPEEHRGKYLGLASPAAIQHLRGLGVTAVELLPIHQFVHSHHLQERGLRNYWGYDTIGFLAPH